MASLKRVYGFVIFLTSLFCLLFEIFIAIASEEILFEVFGENAKGVVKIAITIPMLYGMFLAYWFTTYWCLALALTPNLNDRSFLTDKYFRPFDGKSTAIAELDKVSWSRTLGSGKSKDH